MKKFLCLIPLFFITNSYAYIQVKGFTSLYGAYTKTIYSKSSTNVKRGVDFESNSLFGVNISSKLKGDFYFSAQGIARGDSGISSSKSPWEVTANWAFLGYSFNKSKVKLGCQFLPFTISAEYQDVGVERPYIISTSTTNYLNIFKSFNGLSYSYSTPTYGGELTTKLFGGNNSSELVNSKVGGGSLSFTGIKTKLHASLFYIEPDYKVSELGVGTVPFGDNLISSVFAAEYNSLDYVVLIEYSWFQLSDSSGQSGEKDKRSRLNAFSALFGKKIRNFTPRYTFDFLDLNSELADNSYGSIMNHTIGVNYNLVKDGSIILKAEGKYTDSHKDNSIQVTDQTYLVGVDAVF